MKKPLSCKIQVRTPEGQLHNLEDFTPEAQRKIGVRLNGQVMNYMKNKAFQNGTNAPLTCTMQVRLSDGKLQKIEDFTPEEQNEIGIQLKNQVVKFMRNNMCQSGLKIDRMKELIEEQGMTVKNFCISKGISHRTMCSLIANRGKDIRLDTVIKIAKALEVDLKEIVYW